MLNLKNLIDQLTADYPLVYQHGKYYDSLGEISSDEVAMKVADVLLGLDDDRPVAPRVATLMDELPFRLPPLQPLAPNEIPVANGVLEIKDGAVLFNPELKPVPYRLLANWCPTNIRRDEYGAMILSDKLFSFLTELLTGANLRVVQEYFGSLLIQTKKAQKSLFILGPGGEGKSILIALLQSGVLGRAALNMKLHKLLSNKFQLACAEEKLVVIDEDLANEPLRNSGLFKHLTTQEGLISVERKGIQPYEANISARLLCVGNHYPRAWNDDSFGFTRRLLLVETKPRPADRVDNKDLKDELLEYKDEFFAWCVDGLLRFLENDYNFSESDDIKRALNEYVGTDSPVYDWLMAATDLTCSVGVQFENGSEATTSDLYDVYYYWANHMGRDQLSECKFAREMKRLATNHVVPITYSSNIAEGTTHKKGYKGIKITLGTW